MKIKFKFHPLLWPLLFLLSPILIPYLIIKNIQFKRNKKLAKKYNNKRIARAQKNPLNIPTIKSLSLKIIVEEKTKEGFIGDAAISYLFQTDKGSLLYDIGFGNERAAFNANLKALHITGDNIDSLVISHLHPDHMGGLKAAKKKRITLPGALHMESSKICYVPEFCESDELTVKQVSSPYVLDNNIATTGPLARELFFMGLTEEQALVAHVENKGLVIVSGCGHPGIGTIIDMVRAIIDEPIYAIIGGFHFPITESRGAIAGLQIQRIIGTGKGFFERLTPDDLDKSIEAINQVNPQKILLSAHDSCDYSIERMQNNINCDVEILKAGSSYKL